MSRDEALLDRKLLGRRLAKRLAARIDYLAQLLRHRTKIDDKVRVVKAQIAKLREI